MDIFFSLGIPILFFITAFCASDRVMSSRKYQKDKRSAFIKRLLTILLSEAGIFLVLCIVTRLFMFRDEETIPVSAILFTGALPFAAAMIREFTDKRRTALLFKRSAIAAFALFAAEIVIFNGKSFDRDPQSTYIDLRTVSAPDAAITNEGELLLSGNASITFANLPQYTRALMVEQSRAADIITEPFTATLSIKDDNVTTVFDTRRQRMISSTDSVFAMSFTPYGNIRETHLSFGDVTSPIWISSIRAVSSIPFHFSLIRFFVLSGIVIVLIAVLTFRLWKVTYQPRKYLHRIVVAEMVLFCSLSAVLFVRPFEEPYEWNSQSVSVVDPYAMTLDAFNKGQVYLDVEPSPELKAMENPYNRTERDAAGVGILWDMAYYDGHYYSYFGVAPVLLYYAPYYKLTGKMPTIAMAQSVFGVIAAFAFCMTILSAVKLMAPRPNLLLLLGIMPAALCCTGIYYSIDYTNMYVLPSICGLAFIFITLWTGLTACACKGKLPRILLLFISGVSLSCCAASRPSIALGAVALIPFFLGILRNKKMKPGFKLAQTAAFVVPLLIGGSALMWYNNARFGSPFDFGARYQLTVSDVHANSLHLSGFAPMIYHYILQLPRPRGAFPYFEPNFSMLYNYGRYAYVADAVGVLTYPLTAFGLAMLPVAVQRRGVRFSHSSTKLQRNAFFAVCFAASLLTGWQVYCLGGVNQRYIVDMSVLLIPALAICILRGVSPSGKNPHRYTAAHICLAMTFVISSLMIVSNRFGNINVRHPSTNDICEELMIFWQ